MSKTEKVIVKVENGRAYFVPKDGGDDVLLRQLYGSPPSSDDVNALYSEGVEVYPQALEDPMAWAVREVRDSAQICGVAVASIVIDPGNPLCAEIELGRQSDVDKVSSRDITTQLSQAGYPIQARLVNDGRILHVEHEEDWLARDAILLAQLDSRFDGEIPDAAVDAAVAAVIAKMGPVEKVYFSLKDLLAKEGAETFYQFGRDLYKATACGPWVAAFSRSQGNVYYEKAEAQNADAAWMNDCVSILIGSVVEGSDAEVQPLWLKFPFTQEQLQHAVKDVDAEADRMWREANGQDGEDDESGADTGPSHRG